MAVSEYKAKLPLSVLIPAKNEAANIEKCLGSVAWADEVYVVDSSSDDGTARIAKRNGATVVDFEWDGRGPRKKNWALMNLPWKHEWVLILDADEEVTPELREEIRDVLRHGTSHSGFLVRYFYSFLGRSMRHGDRLWKPVLLRHARARFEDVHVPEVTAYDVELHEHPRIEGTVGRLRSVMVHRDMATKNHFFDRHNTYSDWEALLLTKYRNRERDKEIQGKMFGTPIERRRFAKRLFLSLPGRPLNYFLYSYVLRGGFLDGRAGFIYNVLKSFYWYQIGVKEYELRLREQRERNRPPSNGGKGDSKRKQIDFYREEVDPEEEITRPGCYPRPVKYLLENKIEETWRLFGNHEREGGRRVETVLVVCCGSGMESEMIAKWGKKVVALDLSIDAVKRARVRAQRNSVHYTALAGDVEKLPFPDRSFDLVFVHDGLHHIPDPYAGVREMLRVARQGILVAEPADGILTRLAVKLGVSDLYEEAGNYVYRLDIERLAAVFQESEVHKWMFQRGLVYYQPWTFRIYRLFEPQPFYWLFRLGFRVSNLFLGRWGNALRAVAWKEESRSAAGPFLH